MNLGPAPDPDIPLAPVNLEPEQFEDHEEDDAEAVEPVEADLSGDELEDFDDFTDEEA